MKEQKATNVVWHEHKVTRADRESYLKQKGVVLWFTGLSGSGKSTIANEVAYKLHKMGKLAYVLDGDNIRHGLNKDLAFSPEDRNENIRRISEVAKLFADAGIITLTAFISPYRQYRNFCRELVGPGRFFEIYTKASIETCEKRDTKGLYKKAKEGLIKDFTGINAPYEEPENPELIIDTDKETIEESVEKVMMILKKQNIISSKMVLTKLDKNTNYIVSGLERSGTSMLMQILNAGEIPVAFNDSRPENEYNLKGYFELEGGKIINKLMDKSFPIEKYRGKFIKITSYGLKYLPKARYKIIYSERNIEEIINSMQKMMGKQEEDRAESIKNLIKLNNMIKKQILENKEIEVLFVNYNDILKNPKSNIKKILDFLNLSYENLDKMIDAVDIKLYIERN